MTNKEKELNNKLFYNDMIWMIKGKATQLIRDHDILCEDADELLEMIDSFYFTFNDNYKKEN